MNCKLIRNGNAFYETDDECMEKKNKYYNGNKTQAPHYNTTNMNPDNSYIFPNNSFRK